MKNLELKQMETLVGGDFLGSCAGAAAGAVGYGLAITAILLATGPIGWAAWAGLALTGVTTSLSAVDCAISSVESSR